MNLYKYINKNINMTNMNINIFIDNMNKTNVNQYVGAVQRVYYMTSLMGKKYSVYLDPSMSDVKKIVDSIKIQLPESYNNDKFRIICEGRDLLSFGVFDKGIDSYFRTLATIHVVCGKVVSGEAGSRKVVSEEADTDPKVEDYKDDKNNSLVVKDEDELKSDENKYSYNQYVGSVQRVYFMSSLMGKKYSVYLDPLMSDVKQIVDSIKIQLPESYNNDKFRIICEGRDLLSFGVFDKGVDSYFRTLATIHVVGC